MPLQQLPPELVEHVLSYLDLESLGDAALSCPFLFDAFKQGESLLTKRRLFEQTHHIQVDILGTPSIDKGLDIIPEGAGPDDAELCRTERALYRFQLYCNIVGSMDLVLGKTLVPMFFDHFAIFQSLVVRDIAWGFLRVPYIESYSSPYAKAIVLNGLEKIYDLSLVSNYEQLRFLLSRGDDAGHAPLQLSSFLPLEFGVYRSISRSVKVSDMTEEERETIL
ncbi:hypothetical protein F5B22DRAFT_643198 [Xylaria bambusicola]|uniref:uncharacterized protein n=1 Tax=Xylaria bambusicola TaxID=326684 RepID=UPI002007BC41|nr:uncharacterized protein F5B22DRAFT_643198 [Xylaria bambusicola]KAI0522177.1 hypothetical protein F5B22DRAFT_643198 [Xylaria bambusicola]